MPSDDELTLLRFLAEQGEGPQRGRQTYEGDELATAFGWDPARVNDAVELLDGQGCVERYDTLGTAPYEFRTLTLTATGRALYARLRGR